MDPSAVAGRGVASWQGSGTTDLVAGRAEGFTETAPARAALAENGSCVRLRLQHRNHVWSYDCLRAMTHDGRMLRILVGCPESVRCAQSKTQADQFRRIVE